MTRSKRTQELEALVIAACESCGVQGLFGEPMKLATQTVVPVGAMIASFGSGGGGVPLVGGGGAGVHLRLVPLGVIHEQDGAVRFTPIELPALLEPRDAEHRHAQVGMLAKARQLISAAVTRPAHRDER